MRQVIVMRIPLKFARALAATLLLALLPAIRAQEVQVHGLVFEKWVRDTSFDGYTPTSYTQKWDIPSAANHTHDCVAVNPKAAKYGTPVDMGDVLRQFNIDESFIIVFGYWR